MAGVSWKWNKICFRNIVTYRHSSNCKRHYVSQRAKKRRLNSFKTIKSYVIVIDGPASSIAIAIRSWIEIRVSVRSHARITRNTSSTPTDNTKNNAATTIDWNLISINDISPRAATIESSGMMQPRNDSHGLLWMELTLKIGKLIVKVSMRVTWKRK